MPLPPRRSRGGFVHFAKDQAAESALFVPENIFVNYYGRVRTDLSPLPGDKVLPLFQPTERYEEVRQRSQKSSLGYNLLKVFIIVVENKLTFRWSYDEQLYHASTIERLAQTCLASLQAMIEYSVAHSRR